MTTIPGLPAPTPFQLTPLQSTPLLPTSVLASPAHPARPSATLF